MDYFEKYKHLDDKLLIEEIQNGNEENFEIIYKKYAGRVLKFINRIVRIQNLSEEIVQETFLKLYINIHKYKITDAKFSTYLYRIAYNTAINLVKSLNKERNIIQDLFLNLKHKKPNYDPHSITAEKEEKEVLEKIINGLPYKEKTVFILKSKEDRSNSEIAEILNISQRTVIRKMNAAIKKIYKEMKKLNFL